MRRLAMSLIARTPSSALTAPRVTAAATAPVRVGLSGCVAAGEGVGWGAMLFGRRERENRKKKKKQGKPHAI